MRNQMANLSSTLKLSLTYSLLPALVIGLSVLPNTQSFARTLAKTTSTASQKNVVNTKAVEMFRDSVSKATITGAEIDNPKLQALIGVIESLIQASNDHDLEGILKAYNPQFMSGDNMALSELKSLIQETWQAYPHINYETQLKAIRVSGDWATVETFDTARANIDKPTEGVPIELPGTLYSESQNTLYFKRSGDIWEIMSDAITYEMATIRYGSANDMEIDLETPEQVKAGEPYSAIFNVEPQQGAFVIASVNNQELVFPHPQPEDKFRPMNSSNKSIQRVLKANLSNRNEIVTATVGITRIGESENSDRPSLGLDGIATVVKRVNIIPTSKQEIIKALEAEKQIKRSANGKIDLNQLLQETQQPAAVKTVPQIPSQEDLQQQ